MPVQHPSHYVIEQLGNALQLMEQQFSAAQAEIQRLTALVEAEPVHVEQPDS